jgi:pyruvate formate lyase activating enzyme
MKEAQFYTTKEENTVQCHLCPHECMIKNGKRGICGVRKNVDGTLFSENYGKLCSFSVDPIEKKPLYHFYPGKNIVSIGTVGCNLKCLFCQNCEISQTTVDDHPMLHESSSEEIVKLASDKPHNIGIAYTYNEPSIWYEYVKDTAQIAEKEGLKNVMVTNGYINDKPLRELLPYIHAFNIDLKAWNNDFYKKYTSSKLEPVKSSLKIIGDSSAHLEITNLIIPGLNDDEKEFDDMIHWIARELGEHVPLHLSRYFPTYKMHISATPPQTLLNLAARAKKVLSYVFVGNMSTNGESHTYCPECRQPLILRHRYNTELKNISPDGACNNCGKKITVVI